MSKKQIGWCLVIVWFLFCVISVFGIWVNVGWSQEEPVKLGIELSYGGVDDKAAVGYRLYMDGIMVCDIDAETLEGLSEMECASDLITPGVHEFTTSAMRADGTESPQSAAYEFTIPESTNPDVPAQPVIIYFGVGA